MFINIMASCNSLIKIDDKLLGDPLDIKIFQKTKWEYIDEKTELIDHQAIASVKKPIQTLLVGGEAPEKNPKELETP